MTINSQDYLAYLLALASRFDSLSAALSSVNQPDTGAN
jgi:hypothetical protein